MKYDMFICKCGRIHLIEQERLELSLKDDKNILLICAHCGTAILKGADIEPDWNDPSKNCYMMYTSDLSPYEDVHLNIDSFRGNTRGKAISEIFYSQGISVPMVNGNNANQYTNGKFYDNYYPDFYEVEESCTSVNDVIEFIKDYHHDRSTVDMRKFIRDNSEEVLETVSGYLIRGFNWKGTKYERKV